MLRTTTNPDHTADYIQRHTFELFARFIAEVNGTPVSINSRPTPVVGNISKTAAIILDTEYHCSGMSTLILLYSCLTVFSPPHTNFERQRIQKKDVDMPLQ
jgi:hypothetical protein